MPEDLAAALAGLRALLLDDTRLVRAVASGRRRTQHPRWTRVDVRPVDLRDGRSLQVVTIGAGGPVTANHPYPGEAARVVDELLAEPFGNWHVDTTTETVQLRVTKKGAAQVSRRPAEAVQQTAHDRPARHVLDPGDPLFAVLGANAAKRRQVDAFLRELRIAVRGMAQPPDRPLRVVDLGCGNAYLGFAAYRFLSGEYDDVHLTGVDVRAQSRERNARIAADLGWSSNVDFVAGTILDAPVEPPVDVALALHACDTATDEALARSVIWGAPVVLASPCCHHDVQRQLAKVAPPPPYGLLVRDPIQRERFADVLTDSLRAALLRRAGYRVEVVEFVESKHTPRNTLIRAVRHEGADGSDDYDALVAQWGVTPRLQTLLDDARR